MESKTNEKLKTISVAEILQNAPLELNLKNLSGSENLEDKFINSERIQKLGLAFAGYSKYLHKGRIMMVGQSEIEYLEQLEVKAKKRAIDNLQLENINCILITKDLNLPTQLLERFVGDGIPVLKTPLVSSQAINKLSGYLQNFLAQKITIHGVLLGIYNLGVLIIGKSGIGKSECALDLIRYGHQLISDDSVIIKKVGVRLIGESPELTHEHLEIRGLGIVNIKELFGTSAVGQNTRIDLCIELTKLNKESKFDRIGIKMKSEEIFDIKLPKFILPVSSGRNVASLVETAVRLHLQKLSGNDSVSKLIEKYNSAVSSSGKK